jgi:glutathione S-transferase
VAEAAIEEGVYTIMGSELSPYAVKVRAYMRYKGLPHVWLPKRLMSQEPYKRYARLPIVPTVITPEKEGLQDSTPIIEKLEAQFPEPSIHPEDPVLAFLSALLEEFGDEWGNKIMFHSRWWFETDRQAASRTFALLQDPDARGEALEALRNQAIERMAGRMHFVGSHAEGAPLLYDAFVELTEILGAHLSTRRFLFGARPAFGDFGLACELFQAAQDPTCNSVLRAKGGHVLDWAFRMNEPFATSGFETWEALAPTMEPLLAYVGRYFLPWSDANARALAEGRDEFAVMLAGRPYAQQPQKYHAKSLAALRGRFAKVQGDKGLVEILDLSGCLPFLID